MAITDSRDTAIRFLKIEARHYDSIALYQHYAMSTWTYRGIEERYHFENVTSSRDLEPNPVVPAHRLFQLFPKLAALILMDGVDTTQSALPFHGSRAKIFKPITVIALCEALGTCAHQASLVQLHGSPLHSSVSNPPTRHLVLNQIELIGECCILDTSLLTQYLQIAKCVIHTGSMLSFIPPCKLLAVHETSKTRMGKHSGLYFVRPALRAWSLVERESRKSSSNAPHQVWISS
jgi:hypothetical protein